MTDDEVSNMFLFYGSQVAPVFSAVPRNFCEALIVNRFHAISRDQEFVWNNNDSVGFE